MKLFMNYTLLYWYHKITFLPEWGGSIPDGIAIILVNYVEWGVTDDLAMKLIYYK